jgi:hypothetical protein
VEFYEPGFGTTYSEIDFVLMNNSQSTDQPYSVTSSGTNVAVELKYDSREPTGILGGTDKDTLCVTFDAVPGAQLDSIRVALRRSTTAHGGIWNFTGNIRPSPLGSPLTPVLPITGLTTPPSPYPVPWPNWVSVDLRSYHISASNPFAVGFIVDGVYPDNATINRVMATTQPTPSTITSFTYSTTPASGPNWYYFVSTSAGDSMYVYLIRAYVSFAVTGIAQTVVLAPKAFTLEQNYPNPFNPSTQIEFTLAERDRASLKIYNELGQEVALLFDGQAETGRVYRATFDASRLPSGIYFARLESGTQTSTRKLVLMK